MRARSERSGDRFGSGHRYVQDVVSIGSERSGDRFGRKLSANIPLQKKKLLNRKHWIGNEVETSEALEVAGICTNKGRLSFEAAMLLSLFERQAFLMRFSRFSFWLGEGRDGWSG